MKVCCAADVSEETVIGYEASAGRLKIDTTRSGANQAGKAVEGAPLQLPSGSTLKLRVFVDWSMVEVLANDGLRGLSRAVYPSPGSTGIRLYARGGAAVASSATTWDLMPTNPF